MKTSAAEADCLFEPEAFWNCSKAVAVVVSGDVGSSEQETVWCLWRDIEKEDRPNRREAER